jgi:hypothetical protein
MKYFICIFVTAVIVFLGATIYYKGLPSFPEYSKSSTSTQSGVPVETNESLSTPVAGASATPATDETSDITTAVKAGLVAEHGQDAATLNITVTKIEGEYAEGEASAQGGGGMWYAARLSGKWTLVWDGNGQIDCTSISPYPGFPTDMIPECWDTSTNKLVTR